MAVDKNVTAFQKMLDSKSFNPDAFIMEFMLLSDTEAKMSFLDLIIAAIAQAPYLRNRATDDRARNLYQALIDMGNGFKVDDTGPPVVD